jgi:tRNA pseudouridine32 synthase/23S rRNA pseudouridine746 synthase
MKIDPLGLPSKTRWRVLGRGVSPQGALAFVELEPLTGRTHQLRVHCAAMGWPILGDPVYGSSGKAAGAPPLHLHARRIVVPIDKHKPAVAVEAPVPQHMQAAMRACGWSEASESMSAFKQNEEVFS